MEFFASIINSKNSCLCLIWISLLTGCGKEAIDKIASDDDSIVERPATNSKLMATQTNSTEFLRQGQLTFSELSSVEIPREIRFEGDRELEDVSARIIFEQKNKSRLICRYELLTTTLIFDRCQKRPDLNALDNISMESGDKVTLEIDLSDHLIDLAILKVDLKHNDEKSPLQTRFDPALSFSESDGYQISKNGFVRIPRKIDLNSNPKNDSYSRLQINFDGQSAEVSCFYQNKDGDNFTHYLTDCYNRYGTLMYLNANDEIYIHKGRSIELAVHASDADLELTAEVSLSTDWRD